MWFDIAIILVMMLYMFFGWRTGFLTGIISLVSHIGSLVAAVFLAKPLTIMIDTWWNVSANFESFLGEKGSWITTLICGATVYAICKIIFFVLKRLIKNLKEKHNKINKADKLAGIVFGAINFIITLVSVLIVFELLSSISIVRNALDWLLTTGPVKSYVGEFFHNFAVDYVMPILSDIDALSVFGY